MSASDAIHHGETAQRHMVTHMPTATVEESAGAVLARLAGNEFDYAGAVYVLDSQGRLDGYVPITAFFVPGIVYLADAIGTQTETIAVRGLSLSHAQFSTIVGGEARTGAIIGLTLALCALFPVWWWFQDARLAFSVAIALFIAGTAATTIGVAFPWALARDPAYGSGPLATIVQDVLSLVIYFVTASVLMS